MRAPNFLRGLSGGLEIGRVSLVTGGAFALLTPIAFEIFELGWNGGHFDVTAWCIAYDGGLTGLIAGGVFAIGNKEKQVATAQSIAPAPAAPPPVVNGDVAP